MSITTDEQREAAREAMKSKREAARAAGLAEAARRMQGFEYTLLAKAPGIEAWHCGKPDSGIYHFDITVLRSGIAVTGDINGLLFNVGANYGIPFLLQEDKGYVAQKLEEQCRVKEFDEDTFDHHLAELAANKVDAILPEDADARAELARAAGLPLPEWIGDDCHPSLSLEAVTAWVEEARYNTFVKTNHGKVDGIEDKLDELADTLDSARHIDHATLAHDYLARHEGYFDAGDTWEWRLDRLDSELIQRLYMLEHAAQNITAIKERSRAAEEVAHG